MKKNRKIYVLLLLAVLLAVLIISCQRDAAVPDAAPGDVPQLTLVTARPETPPPEQSSAPAPEDPEAAPPDEARALDEDGVYTTAEDVALYLHTYGHLPSNFITKTKARAAGWDGGSLERVLPGMCIGGGGFENREGQLPDKKGRVWRECDINTLGASSRGAERLVYSNDGLIYYSGDHYESFQLLYGEP